ncbi:MAG: hypothetical protein MUC29_11680 [Pyrinomonadaceae bacterium]|nr:hypothetical protein [Pyrinomonadaceae bacterium]
MKKFTFLIILFFVSTAFSQNSELLLDTGVKPHKGIDEIYAKFSQAYKNLDLDIVTNLYTEDANYLASGQKITDGRAKIRENFGSFFESIKKDGKNMTISFQILQREVDKKLGYDVGIYTIKTFKDGKNLDINQGKFIVITKKIGDKWYFRFDGYSNLEPNTKQ